jgi:hypothetical protein
LVEELGNNLTQEAMVISKFMTMQDVSLQSTPEFLNGIQMTGISRQKNRNDVQFGGGSQDIVTVVKGDIVLNDQYLALGIHLSNLPI